MKKSKTKEETTNCLVGSPTDELSMALKQISDLQKEVKRLSYEVECLGDKLSSEVDCLRELYLRDKFGE